MSWDCPGITDSTDFYGRVEITFIPWLSQMTFKPVLPEPGKPERVQFWRKVAPYAGVAPVKMIT